MMPAIRPGEFFQINDWVFQVESVVDTVVPYVVAKSPDGRYHDADLEVACEYRCPDQRKARAEYHGYANRRD